MTKTVASATLTGTRNGKDISMEVELGWSDAMGRWAWVRRPGNKPFFGSTGYIGGRSDTDVTSYRGQTMVENYTLSNITEQ